MAKWGLYVRVRKAPQVGHQEGSHLQQHHHLSVYVRL